MSSYPEAPPKGVSLGKAVGSCKTIDSVIPVLSDEGIKTINAIRFTLTNMGLADIAGFSAILANPIGILFPTEKNFPDLPSVGKGERGKEAILKDVTNGPRKTINYYRLTNLKVY